jgi:hypothetical protein
MHALGDDWMLVLSGRAIIKDVFSKSREIQKDNRRVLFIARPRRCPCPTF